MFLRAELGCAERCTWLRSIAKHLFIWHLSKSISSRFLPFKCQTNISYIEFVLFWWQEGLLNWDPFSLFDAGHSGACLVLNKTTAPNCPFPLRATSVRMGPLIPLQAGKRRSIVNRESANRFSAIRVSQMRASQDTEAACHSRALSFILGRSHMMPCEYQSRVMLLFWERFLAIQENRDADCEC